jgi:hypothetical protein
MSWELLDSAHLSLLEMVSMIELVLSNFNKGLGPDCFDGNILGINTMLKAKVVEEIVNALNIASIPEYLRTGRLVPL